MTLTDTAIRKAKRLFDGGGLYLNRRG